jgi:hypothetical protein
VFNTKIFKACLNIIVIIKVLISLLSYKNFDILLLNSQNSISFTKYLTKQVMIRLLYLTLKLLIKLKSLKKYKDVV